MEACVDTFSTPIFGNTGEFRFSEPQPQFHQKMFPNNGYLQNPSSQAMSWTDKPVNKMEAVNNNGPTTTESSEGFPSYSNISAAFNLQQLHHGICSVGNLPSWQQPYTFLQNDEGTNETLPMPLSMSNAPTSSAEPLLNNNQFNSFLTESCPTTPTSPYKSPFINEAETGIPTYTLLTTGANTNGANSSNPSLSFTSPNQQASEGNFPISNYVKMATSVSRNVRLRTNTKLDMDRQKAQEEDRRDKELQKQKRAPIQSTAVPVSAQPTVNVVVPSNVLQVKSALENPTPFHMEQTRRLNIKQYCAGIASSMPDVQDTSLGATVALRPPAKRLHQVINDGAVSSAPPNYSTTPISPLSAVDPAPAASPGPSQRSSVATSINDEFEDSILDLILADEKTGDQIQKLDVASLPQTGFNRISGIPEASTSCPVDASPEGLGDGTVKLTKDRIKKDNHNKIERKRRFHINDMITEQSRLLPKANERHHERIGEVKQNKGSILKASVDYTKVLKHDNESLHQKLQKAEQEKKELLLRLQRVEQLCKQTGVQLPEGMVTWKTGSTPEDLTNLLSPPEVRVKQEPIPYVVDDFERNIVDMMDEDRSIVTGSNDPMFGQPVETEEGFQTSEGMDFND